jgi:S-DNA-T family DNA segregation ATPase FtsK/SpoIIIE
VLFRSGIFSRLRSSLRSAESFFSGPDAKFRAAAVAGSAVLGLTALLLALSLLGSLFSLPFASGLGGFFTTSFGFLAFTIPAYLFYAAFILADPSWRPDRIFILSSLLFPFLTLAGGLAVIRDFENMASRSAFLDFTGKAFFSFIVILLTVGEVLLIMTARNLLFPGAGRERRFNLGGARRRGRLRSFLLPPPLPLPKDVYAESAARTQGTALDDESPASLRRAAADPEDPESDLLRKVHAREPVFEGEVCDTPVDFDDDDGIADFETEDQEDAAVNSADAEYPYTEYAAAPADHSASTMTPDVERALSEAEAAAALRAVKRRHGAAHAGSAAARNSSSRNASYSVPVDILNQYPDGQYWIIDAATEDAAITLKETLEEFGIQAEVTGIRKGPVITMFEILPAPGVKLS